MRDPDVGGGGINPSGWLMEPFPEKAIAEEWDTILDVKDKIPGLGNFALFVWEEISGDDIPNAWGEMLAGDWKEVATTSCALRNLGKFCTSYAQALDLSVSAAAAGWEGQAASAMVTYFAGLSAQLDDLATQCDELADECNGIAFGIYEAKTSVEDGVETVFDLVLAAALSLAAAAASSWTVVGGFAGAAAAAATIATAVTKVFQIVGAIEAAFEVANGILGVIASLAPGLGSTVDVNLPGDYDNKVVA